MLSEIISEFSNVVAISQANLGKSLSLVALLWVIHIVNVMLGMGLNAFGIYPRTIKGIPGILLMPFLHGSFSHLLFNSIPLVILTNFILTEGFYVFLLISLLIQFFTGLAVWLLARPAYHIGASGLAMGYYGFLLAHAYYSKSMAALVLGVLCLYYFGSLIFHIFPRGRGESWESHLFGFLSGAFIAWSLPFWLFVVDVYCPLAICKEVMPSIAHPLL